MGSLQKKEMEVSYQMKEEIHTLQIHSCQGLKLPEGGCASSIKKESNRSTLSYAEKKSNQSNDTLQGHRSSKEGNVKLSQSFNPEQQKLSSTDINLGRMGPFDACEAVFHALGAPLDLCMSESSAKTLDTRCVDAKSVHPEYDKMGNSKRKSSASSKDASQLGDGCVAYNNKKEQFLLESVRQQELSLSNISFNEPISLADISGKNNLLNLINYFPQKVTNFCSRKKLLILDINGILADIVYPPPRGYKADTKIAGRAVFTRPFCSDFLGFCLERFNVAIWSSRSRKIIDRLINYLMGDMKHKLTFCWDLSHCTESNFKTLENKHKALVFKELRKVWENHSPDYPWEKGYFNESNTLLLDDTPYKALLNPPHTAIFPYSYNFKDRADSALGARGNIRVYLEELAVADNVQKYIEQHPFGQSAITERSLSWHFYDRVIKGQSPVPARG
uniref:Mitochondrial import inner membrane translocase subunit TIM50 n=1 Tax=Opuntia streptacantha TaxID=393608 RepID=A0A7C9ECY2_OPUST